MGSRIASRALAVAAGTALCAPAPAGAWAEGLPGHDPELARRLRPYLDRVLGMVDDRIGHLAGRIGPGGVLAVGSDHGQIGAVREVRPNREMHASFTVWGAGVASGAELGVIRQIDVAPTVAALLGMEPPRDAEGVVLEAALVPDAPAGLRTPRSRR